MKTAFRVSLILAVLLAGCGSRSVRHNRAEMGEAWLAAYIQDQKVGYSVYRIDRLGDGYRFENTVKMTLGMAGKTQRVSSHSTVNTGKDLALRDFEFSFNSQDRSFSISGVVESGALKITPPGGGKTRSLKLDRAVYPVAALGKLVTDRKLSKDSVYRVPVFDASVLDIITAEVRPLGREKVTAGGKEYDATKFTTKMAKFEMTTWVDDKGLVIVETSPPNMKSERTDPKAALAEGEGTAKFDVLTMFRVPVDTLIPTDRFMTRLKLELTGIDAKQYELAGPGQRVVSENPLVLDIMTVPPPPAPVKLPITGQDEFLKPSVSMQCDDARIKAKAVEAIGNETDAVKAARKLLSWVFTVVDKEATASFPTALDVLEHMRGDCNEHAVFFGALARSVGIPTKIAVGLIYLNGAFYYHAWNEVFLGSWIPVDATFGEFPASALHLKLAEGDLSQQAEILGVVGTIGIKVLGWQTESDTPVPGLGTK